MTLCGFLKVCIRHPLCSTDIAQPTRSVIPQTCSGAACLPQRSRPFVGCPAPSLAGSRDVPAQAWGDIPAPASGLSSASAKCASYRTWPRSGACPGILRTASCLRACSGSRRHRTMLVTQVLKPRDLTAPASSFVRGAAVTTL